MVVVLFICFMAGWHRDEAEESSWLRHAAEDTKSDDKGKVGRGWGGSRTDTAVGEIRNEMVDRVARYRTSKWNLSCYNPRILVVLFGFRRFAHGRGA